VRAVSTDKLSKVLGDEREPKQFKIDFWDCRPPML
jgi:hypothetical protein